MAQIECRVGAEDQQAFRRQQHRLDADIARQLIDDLAQVLQRQIHADHAHRCRIGCIAGPAQRQVVTGVQAAAIGVHVGLGPPCPALALGTQIPGHRAIVVPQFQRGFFRHACAVAMHVPDKPAVAGLLRAPLDDQARCTDIRIAGERGQQQCTQIERLQADPAAAGRQRAPAHLHRIQHRRQAARSLFGQAIHLGARRVHQLGARAQVEHRAQHRQQGHQHRGGRQQHTHAQAATPRHARGDRCPGWQ